MARRVRVHLHGPLAAYHDGVIEVVAETAWEAIEAVTTQVPGFQPSLQSGRQVIQIAGHPTVTTLRQSLQVDDLHLMPALVFAKNTGIIQVLVGSVLIAAGALIPGIAGTPFGMMLIGMGVSMIAGAVVQALSPQPQLNVGTEDNVRSKYLAGSKNTVQIGTPIPLGYGRRRCGGHLLSVNIDAKDTGL
jgi:predicted phage tail protein